MLVRLLDHKNQYCMDRVAQYRNQERFSGADKHTQAVPAHDINAAHVGAHQGADIGKGTGPKHIHIVLHDTHIHKLPSTASGFERKR